MPSITIGDGLKADLIVAMPDLSGGLGKYLKDPAALLANFDLGSQLKKPLNEARSGDAGLGLLAEPGRPYAKEFLERFDAEPVGDRIYRLQS